MATTAPVILRLVASSVCVARRAGSIIRDVMKKGELGIVEKVPVFFDILVTCPRLGPSLGLGEGPQG